MFQASPEPISPAESSLTLAQMRLGAGEGGTELESLVTRPIFWDGRQPYAPPANIEVPAEDDSAGHENTLENFTIVGTYGVGEDAGVIVAHRGSRYRLKLQESIEGWKLAHVAGDQVIFEKGLKMAIVIFD